ncbi:methionyl-tRNA formyltransferase Fmt [Gottschalkia purinilytica]|uniref:Methionyl-tRNA formyltransferase n=1 Tax=Gottschalkia purinilytica TaxID=1503 RepID=A0A0L0WB32_GOTPU|nr:methionyl-tRNA formyltransferase [Gottschalkia purinilytica]KNF08739.1 methionyl-tRNA formyltransferase Fmt [Gottschalkia purinilytica]
MKVVFMGTPDFAVPTLEAIYNNGHQIPLVITQTDKQKGRGKKVTPPPVKEKALELGIQVHQPHNVNDKETITMLKEISPDVIVVVAYGQILKEEILNLPKYRCINVHASLLPRYRGAAPINWVIINGENRTGVTIMEMSKGLDTGDMLLKEEIEIGQDETAGNLHDRLMSIGANLLTKTLNELEKGNIVKVPQNDEESTYAPIMTKSLGKINWDKCGSEIKNLVRGTQPWPGSFFEYEGKNVKILEVDVDNKFKEGKNGEIVKVNKDGIFVNVEDKCVIIKRIQFPGKKAMSIEEFLRGNKFECGISLK